MAMALLYGTAELGCGLTLKLLERGSTVLPGAVLMQNGIHLGMRKGKPKIMACILYDTGLKFTSCVKPVETASAIGKSLFRIGIVKTP